MKLKIVVLFSALLIAPANSARAQSYFYDAAGRLTQVAYPNGNGIRYTYDEADNIVSAGGINLPPAPAGLDVSRTSPTTARLTWAAPSGNATGVVIMRRLSTSNVWEEIATVAVGATTFIDTSLTPGAQYVYRIAARGGNGLSAYSRELSPSSASSINVAVPGVGARTLTTLGASADVQAGYATVDIDSGSTPYGTAVFSLAANDVIVSEAGVPASPPTKSARIFIDYRTGVTASSNQFTGTLTVNTGLAMANLGGRAANINYILRDMEGRTIATGSGMLVAGGHVAKVISDLRSIAPNFELPPDFPTATRFGSLEITSDQPLSVMALRATTNQRGDLLFTTTPVADLTEPLSFDAAFFPQFADGGGFSTSLFLLNTSDRVQTGTLEVFGDDGAPLTVKPLGSAAASSFNYSIQPGGVFVFESEGASAAVTAGWVRVSPSFARAVPVGSGAFRLVQGGTVVTESGISPALPTTRARLYVDKSAGHDTGIAIANPGGSSSTITLRAFQTDGTTASGSGPVSFTLNGRGHRANLAGDLISGLPSGFTGIMEVSSQVPFVALTLRALINSRGDLLLTTFPNADLTRPAPSPLIFPHIADGAGFKTELILLGPITPAATVVRFFGDDGSPLAVGDVP